MARRPHPAPLSVAVLAIALSVARLPAQSPAARAVSLAEAAERVAPDFRPKLLGEQVKVSGIVSAPILDAPDASYLSLLDGTGKNNALLLVFSGDNKAQQPAPGEVRSGQIVEALGIVSLHAGIAVVKPTQISITGSATPPLPIRLRPVEAASFRHEGMLARIEGVVSEYREASSGDLLEFTETGESLRVFLPLRKRGIEHPLSVFRRGDRVRVRGLISQFCISPPYNRFFQVLVSNGKDVELVEPRAAVPPQIVPAAVLVVLLSILAGWYYQQRAGRQNKLIQRILNFSDELHEATSAREVADTLRKCLLEIVPASSIHVYRYDPERKVLERIPDNETFAPHSFHIDECKTSRENALALAVRNRTLLQFSDTRASELLGAANEPASSLLLIPMRHRDQARGAVAALGKPGNLLLPEALHPATQHLVNDTSRALESLEQAAVREQIHRSEKLAVAGQLIHGVITELNTPLESIRRLTSSLPDLEAAAIHVQVQKASETVRRIVSVARAEQIDARPVELRGLFQRLLAEIEEELANSRLESEVNLSPDPLFILGSQDQLAKVFENLLLHARAAAMFSLEHALILNVNRIGRSAMIEIEFSGPFGENEGPDFSPAALGLAICRGLLQSHGGEIRFLTLRSGRFRYEVELPSLSSNLSEDLEKGLDASPSKGQITALLVEPDFHAQRRMLAVFSELNHRLIPVGNIEEAADLADKVRFDVVLATTRPEGGTWAELFHRVHHRTPHFALMTESAEEPTAADLLDGASSSMLRKPIEENDVRALLNRLQQTNHASSR
jgi:signal transduction histidine kinase/CheY-like chemotaxis protein